MSDNGTATSLLETHTAGAMVQFLDTVAEKGWINVSTAKAMKTASIQILDIEAGWEALDLRALDVEEMFERFRHLKRNAYSDDSMRIYKSRFAKAVQMYLTRLDGGDWKALAPTPRSHGRVSSAGRRSRTALSVASEVAGELLDVEVPEAPPPARAGQVPLMRFPFPLRDTVDVWLSLPRDLTADEAARLCGYIRSLARHESGSADASA